MRRPDVVLGQRAGSHHGLLASAIAAGSRLLACNADTQMDLWLGQVETTSQSAVTYDSYSPRRKSITRPGDVIEGIRSISSIKPSDTSLSDGKRAR
jgi:hypothetical protein